MKTADRSGVLGAIDSNIKMFSLVVLAMEAIFLASLVALPKEDIKGALIIMALVGTITICAGVLLHYIDRRSQFDGAMSRSKQTPDIPFLNKLVEGAMETVCRALSIPLHLQSTKLRVFIFRVENAALVCRYFWAMDQTTEAVGMSFELTRQKADDGVVVVQAALDRQIRRSEAKPLPPNTSRGKGEVAGDLVYILAAPIFDGDRVWGVVDFDTSSTEGRQLLENEITDPAMFQLARHLNVVFGLKYPT